MGDRWEDETDEALVAALRTSVPDDLRAFDELVRRYQSHVLTNCRHLTRAEPDVADLAQEVLVKAYFGLKGFRGESRLRTWLDRIKLNHCLNHLRRHRPEEVSVESLNEAGVELRHSGPLPSQELEAKGRRGRINAVLDGMRDTLRIALVLKDYDGLTYDEIAEALGIGVPAAKMRVKRARQEFRERFGPREISHAGSEAPASAHSRAPGRASPEPARRVKRPEKGYAV
jgi:RNA polymerase sigma-70 factor (ECF subfamily)